MKIHGGGVWGQRWLALGQESVLALALVVSLWAVAALYFDSPVPCLRVPGALLYGSAVGAMLWFSGAHHKGILLLWLGSLIVVIAWWLSLAPTNNRPWQPDVAELPWAVRQGDLVTIHNVRNFIYRSETDYTQRWETQTVDLATIGGVDLFLIHFGSPWIAHAIVSFQFGDGTFVAMSIEQRKVIDQSYSTLRGFFRQYELIYLVVDERDVVRLRTNYRTGEDVRFYHTLTKPEDARRLFLQYLDWIETQRDHPQWYNALTNNCSSSVTTYLEKNRIGGLSRWDWRNFLNGLGDQMLYDHGDLATGGLSFGDLAQQALINDEAKRLAEDPNFSRDIRQGHPGF